MYENIKSRFSLRKGFFNQPYYSVRIRNCEITIDNLLPTPCFQLSLCTPYNERIDKLNHKHIGAGEVKRWWYFNDEDEVYGFIAKDPILSKLIMV